MNTSCRVRPHSPEGGFTLVELLIAMTLTAVIGMVLFSTYGMVMDNGRAVRNRVLEREGERIFRGIIDNDMAGLCLVDDKHSTLPMPSRQPITLSETYYRLTEADRPDTSDDRILMSFATSTRLADAEETPLPGPVCVEYVLRGGSRGDAFIRRERGFCGVDGDFPWTEMVLVRGVASLTIDLFSGKTDFVSEWSAKADQVPEALRFNLRREGEETPESFVVPVFPRRSRAAR